MTTKLKMLLMLAIAYTLSGRAVSQTAVNFSADLMSRYVWRGLDLGGKSPSIQPGCKFTWTGKKATHSLSVGAWGAYTFAATANDEFDLSLGYTFKNMLSVSVTDYFFPGLNNGAKDKYFEYGPDSTGHVLEGSISFNGTEKIPVTLLFAMNFYGNDARKMIDDTTTGDIMMSKYAEIGFKKSFKSFDFNAFAGVALDEADKISGASFYLNKNINLINIGIKCTRNIKITEDYSLPVQCSVIANPELQKFYAVFGITF